MIERLRTSIREAALRRVRITRFKLTRDEYVSLLNEVWGRYGRIVPPNGPMYFQGIEVRMR